MPKRKLALLPPSVLVGCARCAYKTSCGGMDGQQTLLGCFDMCSAQCGSDASSCDWVCPRKPNFVDLMREVGGFHRTVGPLRPLSLPTLPRYVPMIRHSSGRDFCLSAPVVALSIVDVLKISNRGHYAPVARSGAELREKFGLQPDATVLLVSVAADKHIERYWRFRRRDETSAALAEIGVAGMTVPNYSFFDDAPRTHTVRNRERMLRVAEELSEAGIEVVLHLNAQSPSDWQYWTRLLKDHPTIRYVAKEFQTGLQKRARAEGALSAMRKLQDDVSRPLHPVVIGGMRYIRQLHSIFPNRLTLIDSTPFLKAVSRQKRVLAGQRFKWESHPTAPGAPLDDLLEDNIRKHIAHIDRILGGRAPQVAVAA